MNLRLDKLLSGKKVVRRVSVEMPAGVMEYKVLKIERTNIRSV